MEAVVEEDIEYVELLHDEHHEPNAEDDLVGVKDEEQQQNCMKEKENDSNEREEACEEDQVMLVEATEVLGDMDVDETQHTIIEHDGRQVKLDQN